MSRDGAYYVQFELGRLSGDMNTHTLLIPLQAATNEDAVREGQRMFMEHRDLGQSNPSFRVFHLIHEERAEEK
ncbi:MAG: hypothetical protein O2794_01025 [bacterium]|nr:hypothetical protein [bacterium]